MTLADEEAVLERANHDPQQFGPVFDAYYPKIFGYAMRRTGLYDVARDPTHKSVGMMLTKKRLGLLEGSSRTDARALIHESIVSRKQQKLE